MTDPISPEASARLEEAVARDPGADGFAALADAHRRAGRLADAERVAREGLERKPGSLEGAVVLSLTLLDQNRIVEARGALERVAGEALGAPRGDALPGPVDDFSDAELERAFEQAEPERDQLIDADDIAQRAMRDADRALADELAARPDSAFATRTVADLLERQGDARGATRIRSALERAATPSASGTTRRSDPVATLERWLANLRGPR